MSLLSKLVSPELARGTWNSGLLATGTTHTPLHTPYHMPLHISWHTPSEIPFHTPSHTSLPIPAHTPSHTPPILHPLIHPLIHLQSYTLPYTFSYTSNPTPYHAPRTTPSHTPPILHPSIHRGGHIRSCTRRHRHHRLLHLHAQRPISQRPLYSHCDWDDHHHIFMCTIFRSNGGLVHCLYSKMKYSKCISFPWFSLFLFQSQMQTEGRSPLVKRDRTFTPIVLERPVSPYTIYYFTYTFFSIETSRFFNKRY